MSRTKAVTALAVDSVDLFDGDRLVGSPRIASDGTWSLPIIELSNGAHVFVAKTRGGEIVSSPRTVMVEGLDIGADHTKTLTQFWIVKGRAPYPAPPAMRYQREATGGVPPYVYSSSNVNVALVNAATGEVTPVDNGTATITVVDSGGQSAEYRLTFAGIRYVALLTNVWWAPSGPERAWVSSALSLQEMRDLFLSYQPLVPSLVLYLGWPDEHYWTSTDSEGEAYAYAFGLNGDAQGYREYGATRLPTVLKA